VSKRATPHNCKLSHLQSERAAIEHIIGCLPKVNLELNSKFLKSNFVLKFWKFPKFRIYLEWGYRHPFQIGEIFGKFQILEHEF